MCIIRVSQTILVIHKVRLSSTRWRLGWVVGVVGADEIGVGVKGKVEDGACADSERSSTVKVPSVLKIDVKEPK